MVPLPNATKEYRLFKYGSVDNLTLTQSPLPSSLAPDDILVKTIAVSLQVLSSLVCRVSSQRLEFRDLVVVEGNYPGIDKNADTRLLPCSDMAGNIVAVGSSVRDWKVGDRVCSNFFPDHVHGYTVDPVAAIAALGGNVDGVLTEYKIFKGHSLVKIPDHLSYEEAATLPCAAVTAYNALTGPTPIKAGDTVLVQGTGGVSMFGLQIAVASGATVIATSSSDDKLQVAKKLGAKHVINYKKTPDWDQEVLKITEGQGVNFILEVGGSGTLEKSMSCTSPGGVIAIIGVVSGFGLSSSINIVMGAIQRGLIIRGIQTGSVQLFNNLLRLMTANQEVTRPVIDKVFEFEDAVAAYKHLESQKHVGKIVIRVSKE